MILEQAEGNGTDLSKLINDTFKSRSFERHDQALITELVYGIFRHKALLDWWIEQFSQVKRIKKPTRMILRLALYQLIFLDRIPDYAVVNSAVNFAKEADSILASRFVNGLLRNVIRRRESLPQPNRDNIVQYISLTTSHPEWMVRRWLARWGEEKTLALCHANNETPPMCLRVNRLRTSRDALMENLIQAGGEVEFGRLSPDALIVKGLSVSALPAFKRGEFYVQDEGAQLTAFLLGAKPGERILDFCAAPGGKTTHLAEITEGRAEIIATDSNSERLLLLEENLKRLQTPNICVKEITEVLSDNQKYDRILVDAPCSALGILRRIPDGKWSKKASIVSSYAETQLEILQKVSPHLKVGGSLLYVTCSTEQEENEDVAEAFSNQFPEMKIENLLETLPSSARKYVDKKGYFTSTFNSDRLDRFFAVRWKKTG